MTQPHADMVPRKGARVPRTIGMPHLGGESAHRRPLRVLLREGEPGVEETALAAEVSEASHVQGYSARLSSLS